MKYDIKYIKYNTSIQVEDVMTNCITPPSSVCVWLWVCLCVWLCACVRVCTCVLDSDGQDSSPRLIWDWSALSPLSSSSRAVGLIMERRRRYFWWRCARTKRSEEYFDERIYVLLLIRRWIYQEVIRGEWLVRSGWRSPCEEASDRWAEWGSYA